MLVNLTLHISSTLCTPMWSLVHVAVSHLFFFFSFFHLPVLVPLSVLLPADCEILVYVYTTILLYYTNTVVHVAVSHLFFSFFHSPVLVPVSVLLPADYEILVYYYPVVVGSLVHSARLLLALTTLFGWVALVDVVLPKYQYLVLGHSRPHRIVCLSIIKGTYH